MDISNLEKVQIYEVYKITNTKNNKVYIGATTQGSLKRFKQHIWKSLGSSKYALHQAIRDDGESSFIVDTIEFVNSVEELKDREKYWIIQYRSNNPEYGYNGDCGGDIMFHTEETKAKISAVHKGKDMSKRYKAVLQYDLNGNFIQEFPSVAHACDYTGICRASLIRGLQHIFKNKSKVNPYIWVYKSEYPAIPKKIDTKGLTGDPNFKRIMSDNFIKARNSNLIENGNTDNLKKPVVQFDLNGNKLAEYESISQASKVTGISNTTIRDYCKGKFDEKLKDPKFLKRASYTWKYKDI